MAARMPFDVQGLQKLSTGLGGEGRRGRVASGPRDLMLLWLGRIGVENRSWDLLLLSYAGEGGEAGMPG
jgi:hypothetical protein